MDPLPKIPSPPTHHWREFRIRVLPMLVFLLIGFLVVHLWTDTAPSTNLVGEVEKHQANLISPQTGRLEDLTVDRFDTVTQGQILARVVMTTPETLQASLAAIRADLQVMRARMEQDSERNLQNFVQFRVDLLARKVELAVAEARLRQAESEFQRVRSLHEQQIASTTEYDLALAERDALKVEVTQLAGLVGEMEAALPQIQPAGMEGVDSPILAAIEAQEKQLESLEKPAVLRAPMDGMVSKIYRYVGEYVTDGEPILAITAVKAERIIGYIRQPLSIEPKVGMEVRIRTRGPERQEAVSQIVKVSSEMEWVANPLRVRGLDPSQERGLPFLLHLPTGLNVRPGELVDLTILNQPN